ncbi:hypothetical protein DFQ27_004700 [Actinomortierella ambigua]|uniref:Uncharacterized protein n=1 Tax=Actinomortierella ambigua TaxID=1343610 RepID=A0A9P6QJZ8_9FUNG|nr:hypothetical protein DFQ27_004700 [Actinomortierella ambigua]
MNMRMSLALTCKHLRRIVFDGHLRRHILLIRTPARLSSSLSHRPSRGELASQNILRGVHIQQHIREGAYINGESSVRSYQASCRLERQFLSQRISRKLRTRPTWLELAERGLLPQEMFVHDEEDEVRRRWAAYNLHLHDDTAGTGTDSGSGSNISSLELLGHAQQQSRLLTMNDSDGSDNGDGDSEGEGGLEEEEMDYGQEHQKDDGDDNMRDSEMGELPSIATHAAPPPAPPPPFSTLSLSALPPSSSSTAEAAATTATATAAAVSTATASPPRRRKNVSMVLVPKMERLRKAMERDRLSRLVQRRPSPEELYRSPRLAAVLQTYHLVAFSTTSPDLVPITAQLHFLLRAERLRHWFHHSRPSLATMLNERHYLKTEPRTAWMVCPGVGPNVRFYEQLIQQAMLYRQQQEAYLASRKKF